MLWSAGEGGGVGHWKDVLVRGIEDCLDENCDCEEGRGGALQGTVKLSIC